MDFPHPTADWNQLHHYYYRKKEVYSMLWEDIDLSKYMVASAPYGGAVAITRDQKKIVKLEGHALTPAVQIFTSSGKLISWFPWEQKSIVQMGWSNKERLICVLEDATILLISIHGELLNQFTVKECRDQAVLDCRIWGNGVVLMTNNLQFFAVYNIETKPISQQLADPMLRELPASWTIIEPQFTISSTVEVLLANIHGSIVVLDSERALDLRVDFGPFTKMAVSPTGKILAVYTQSGNLQVVSTDFKKNLSQFNVKSKIPPQQLVWCGNDSVVLYWDKIVLMVGPYGGWIKYSYEEPLHLAPEVDGVRIISNHKCEFLSRVPACTESIFKIGSTTAAATLHDALDNFEKKSPKADENIRSIKNELSTAVNECIEAAGHEYSTYLQQNLLKAASFGKCFLDHHDPEPFVKMCKALRVLNAVRHPEIGIPLTLNQYKQYGVESLVERLVNRNHHLLAYRICEYLRVKTDRVLVHWASAKVKTKADDAEISNLIVQKLAGLPSVSYVDIATTALQYKRQQLALMLLEYEPRAMDQVPLLISMGQDELALNKAIESGDTDLVYMVLLHIKKSRSLGEFFRIIKNKPFAVDLYISYCRQQDLEQLVTIYQNYGQYIDIANIRVLQAYQRDSTDERLQGLEQAMIAYKKGEDAFAAKATEDQIRLLLFQEELERELNRKGFVNLSLNDTLSQLIKLGQPKRVQKLRDAFKVPDKRFWWIKARALAGNAEWDELLRFAKEKKSPIGYKPFAELCLEKNNIREAAIYISMISEPSVRVEMYLKINYFDEAADVAGRELKDPELAASIRNKATAARERGLGR